MIALLPPFNGTFCLNIALNDCISPWRGSNLLIDELFSPSLLSLVLGICPRKLLEAEVMQSKRASKRGRDTEVNAVQCDCKRFNFIDILMIDRVAENDIQSRPTDFNGNKAWLGFVLLLLYDL